VGQWKSSKGRRVLAALKRIGWKQVRQKGSHRILHRDGWPPYLFAYHDGDEIGPVRLAQIGAETGLTPDDL
jgi:predicted RNA binding protein YcfA (HicA-like mRNA interferase family)